MKSVNLICVILLMHLCSFSQTRKVDSLSLLLSKSGNTGRQDILYELAYEYVDLDYEKALTYAREGFSIAQKRKDTLNIVRLGRLKSLAFRRLNELDSSLNVSLLIQSIALKHGFVDELKHIYNGLAVVYLSKAQYDKALGNFFESLESRKRGGDSLEIGIALQNIGFVFYQLEEYNKALLYFNQALLMRGKLRDKYDLDVLLVNMSLCYIYQNNFGKAHEFLSRAGNLCSSECSGFLLTNMKLAQGLIMIKTGDLSGAEQEFLGSYNLAKKINNERLQLDNISLLIEIYCQWNNIKSAEQYLKEADRLINAGTPFNNEIIELYKLLITLYKKSNNSEKVILYQSKYIFLKDSIYSKELTTNLMKLEAEYVERESAAKIESQNKILALNQEIINRQTIVNIAIICATILLIIVAILLIRNNLLKRKANQLLDKKVKERTRELETNKKTLQRAWMERHIVITRASAEIHSLIATLRGLSHLGAIEFDHPRTADYWRELDTTSNRLSAILNKLNFSVESEQIEKSS